MFNKLLFNSGNYSENAA